MEYISQLYRQACRELKLPPQEKSQFMRLLREVSVNAVRSRKAWTVKEDFITLWWMSAGRFPGLHHNPYGPAIGDWISQHLPFELSPSEKQSLWE